MQYFPRACIDVDGEYLFYLILITFLTVYRHEIIIVTVLGACRFGGNAVLVFIPTAFARSMSVGYIKRCKLLSVIIDVFVHKRLHGLSCRTTSGTKQLLLDGVIDGFCLFDVCIRTVIHIDDDVASWTGGIIYQFYLFIYVQLTELYISLFLVSACRKYHQEAYE